MSLGGSERPVLIVDRDERARARLRAALAKLRPPVAVLEAGETKSMLGLAEQAALVLLDTEMTDVEMVDALALLRERHPTLPVVIVSATSDPDQMRRALEMGAASYASKHVPVAHLCQILEAALSGHPVLDTELVRPALLRDDLLPDRLRGREWKIIESLVLAGEARNRVASRHVHGVAALAIRVARLVNPRLAESEDFLFGCLLHDIGKLGVPGRILNKPGPLTAAEWDVMRRHPETGARVIRPLGLGGTVRDIVLHHHERWDGDGYPTGLAGAGIPLSARIVAICDALDAMTTFRPYRAPLPLAEALGRIHEGAGGQFDPALVAALDETLAGETSEPLGTRGRMVLAAQLAS